MKSRESLLRLRQFDVDEKRQKVSDLEMMIADFQRLAVDLEQQIAAEEARAGISDVNHFAYPPFAKAAIKRRDNLRNSVADLEAKLEEARSELEEAVTELKKIQLIGERAAEGSAEGARTGTHATGSHGPSVAPTDTPTY